MKRLTVMLALALAVGIAVGSPRIDAQEPLTRYDNFNSSPLINPLRWFADDFGVLESVRLIQLTTSTDREVRLDARAWGSTATSAPEGVRGGNNRLLFRRADVNLVRAIQATIRVQASQSLGCSAPGSAVTQARFRILGYFFNAGDPRHGSAENDVFAALDVRRLSDATDPVNVLSVRALVFRCLSENCGDGQTLFNATLGTVTLGSNAILRLQWDPANNRFLFRLNANPFVVAPYSLSDSLPPANNFFTKKWLGIDHSVASCTTSPRPVAFMSAIVDDVFVNTAASLSLPRPTLEPEAEALTDGVQVHGGVPRVEGEDE